MRLALIGGGLLLAGAAAVLLGVLPADEALALGRRVWPVLLFAAAVTVVAELAARAGVFSAAAERLSRLGRGRGWLLWSLCALLALVVTVFFSIDTTAVLLTPVVVTLARHVRMDPMPFALVTVWLASTGSLLLPVSNLTNLLAQQALDPLSPLTFAARMAAPAVVAAAVPCAVVLLVHRRALLIGVNAGAIITPWASLAVLLWHERLRAADVVFPWRRFVLLGLAVAPLTVAAATGALLLTG